MIRNLHEKIGDVKPERLLAGMEPEPLVRGGTIDKAEEEIMLKKGTLLGKKSGKLLPYPYKGNEGGTVVPDCVLTDDVTVGTKCGENVTVYITGNFDTDSVIVDASYSLTESDFDTLRTKGILFTTSQGIGYNVVTHATVIPGSGDTQFYEKKASELQTDIVIRDGNITGTLLYVTGYTGFSKEDNDGNFLALSVVAPEGSTVYGELVNAIKTPGKLKIDDGVFVCRIADPNTQRIRITTEKDGESETVSYNLSGLVLKSK